MPDVRANDLLFHVEDEGVGTPIVLLHGFPDTADLWRAQIAALAPAGYRAIAPDLRGRGRSERPARVEDYALSAIVKDVAAILDALGVERAHVVGHDWGAVVAWLFATRYAERVDRLVAISVGHPGTGGRPTLEELQKGWYRILLQFEGIAEQLIQQDDWYLLRELMHGGGDVERAITDLSAPGALTAALNWYRANGRVERLLSTPGPFPQIQAPTLGIWSSGDLYLTEDRMVRSAAHVAGSWRYERIEGVSHWIPLDAPDALNRLLLDWLPRPR